MAEKKGKIPKSYYRFGIFTAVYKAFEDESFIVGGQHVTLSEIENKVLRGNFSEPRIHSTLNCATGSCPIIRPEAFSPEKLGEQLDKATEEFINSDRGVRIRKSGEVEVSRIILSWYKNDFKNKFGSILNFLKKYASGERQDALNKLTSDSQLKPMKYDWKINS